MIPAATEGAAPRPHGTDARYAKGPAEDGRPGSCRCTPCTAAHTEAQNHRSRLIAYGRWEPFTDAGPAREHIRKLGAQGIGWQQVARIAGLSAGTVSHLLYGAAGRPAGRRVRKETSAAILAVRPSVDTLTACTPVDATGSRRRVQALAAAGHAIPALARRLGMQPSNLRTTMARDRVKAATARAIRDLYDELWDAAPDESTPSAARHAAAARADAARNGWPVPAAWDDYAIDNPGAFPAEDWKRHDTKLRNSAALVEDATELIEGQGYDRLNAARRLGVSRHALDKAFARTAAAAADSAESGDVTDAA